MTAGAAGVRLLIHTGKGGVGKTTTAAATAVRLAERGVRTLITSTDAAHSLADVLGQPVGQEPTRVMAHLDAEQGDGQRRLRDGWYEISRYLRSLLAWGGASDLEAAELAVLPGLDEVFALLGLQAHAAGGRYDVIVVDCAPTAETLRLLSLPDVLGWYIERLLPVQRQVARALRPVSSRIAAMPMPRDAVFDAVQCLYHQVQQARALLLDRASTSVRLVVTPDRVVLAEARRTLTSLALFGYPVDAVIVNRLVPASTRDPLLAGWRRRQQAVAAEIAATFGQIPRLDVPLAGDEPVGAAALRRLADQLYGERDPSTILHDGPRARIVDTAAGTELRLPLPHAAAGEVDLRQRADELYVTVGGHTRSLVLPVDLCDRQVISARVESTWLSITFSPREPQAARVGAAGA